MAGRVCDWIKAEWGTKVGQRGYQALCAWYRDPGRTGGTFTAGSVPFCRADDGTTSGAPPPATIDAFGIGAAVNGIVQGLLEVVGRGILLMAIVGVLLMGLWILFRDRELVIQEVRRMPGRAAGMVTGR